jgi:hypothetical protein
MLSARKVLLALWVITPVINPGICLSAKPSSTSTSRQFLIFGAEVSVRGAICDLAERTKSHLLHLLSQHDNWKTPLLINLDYPQVNYPDLREARIEVSQLGFGLKLQLNLLVTPELQGRAVQREILRAILIEWIYRGRANVAAGSPCVSPPDWLLDGLLALQPGNEIGITAELLQTVVDANKIAPLEDVVKQTHSRLDAASRKLFEAYSQALLQLLLETPNGRQKLLQYLMDLPDAPNDALADLRVHFPETLGHAPDKWWGLSVARLSAANRHEILGATQTSKLLDRLLHFRIADRDGKTREYSLGDYAIFRKLPGYPGVLERIGRQLLLLSARAHPSYRAIVQEDYELTELLGSGQTKGVRQRLARVESYRAVIERRANEIDDYLNWYEATQLKTISGAFTEVLKNAQAPEENRPHRRDAISVYLDSIEMEMQ